MFFGIWFARYHNFVPGGTTNQSSVSNAELRQIPSKPTTPALATQLYPWKTDIVTTAFWIGTQARATSVWDANWARNYGGYDDPD